MIETLVRHAELRALNPTGVRDPEERGVMKATRVFITTLGLVGLLILPAQTKASDDGNYTKYTLNFIPTQNAPPGATGTMTITLLSNGATDVYFNVRGVYPDTVYTIWIVYNNLAWQPDDPNNLTTTSVPSTSAALRPAFPPEGNGVAPLARLDGAFTSGMGQDPGASFITDRNGNGSIQLRLDYNLLGGTVDGPPVGNVPRIFIRQIDPRQMSQPQHGRVLMNNLGPGL
jgi:hypothetical protein